MKLISIVTPCYNEEDNVEELHRQIKAIFENIKNYRYEHIFIDNSSTDNTVKILRKLAEKDPNVKVIVNTRNFGHIRSPIHGLLQAKGDAVILMASDLQDPPELIPEFIKKWEMGFKVVAGTKPTTKEKFPMSFIRRAYYHFISKIADIKLIKNFTGFGLYDRKILEILRDVNDSYPYFRGLISEIGYPVAEVPFHQPRRARGITKNNFYTLYDMAMLGITSHSKVPIRLATMAGFFLSALSFSLAIIFLFLKLFFWNHFPLGIAPMLIGIFFFASIQLFFIGILGEYVLTIHTQVLKRPLVVEQERINF
jgi:glycosyltransferase involved in cell wall biosynthesis